MYEQVFNLSVVALVLVFLRLNTWTIEKNIREVQRARQELQEGIEAVRRAINDLPSQIGCAKNADNKSGCNP